MALTKISTGMISEAVGSVDLNIDANTMFIDVSTNRVGINNNSPAVPLDITGAVNMSSTLALTSHLDMPDSAIIKLGTGDDLTLYHDGSNSFITNDTGILNITNNDIRFKTSGAETTLRAVANGAVELMYDNSTKLATASGGVSITGQLDLSSHLDMPDNAYIKLGTGDDLLMTHDGSGSYIIDNGTGGLVIAASGLYIKNAAYNETGLSFVENGAVTLYYDNAAKLATVSGGINVTGAVNSTGEMRITNPSGVSQLYLYGASGQKSNIVLNEYGVRAWQIGAGTVTSGDLSIWDGTNNRIHIKGTNGNVGIGTASPDGKLSVTSTTANSEDVLYLKSGADSVDDYLGMAFEIGVGGNGPHGAVRVYGGPSGNDSYMSLLTTTDGGTLVQQMTIDHVGSIHMPNGVTQVGQKFNTRHTDFAGNAYSTTNDGILTIGSETGDHQAVLMLGNQNIGDNSEIGSVTFGSQSAKQASITATYNSGGNGHLRFGTNDGNTFSTKMTIQDSGQIDMGAARRPAFKASYWGYAAGYRALVIGSASTNYQTDTTGSTTPWFNYDPVVNSSGSFGGGGTEVGFRRATQFKTPNAANDGYYTQFTMTDGVSSGDFNDTSDIGLKKNIVDISNATATIKALRPRIFDWKDDGKGNGLGGFIAQEVETVLPNDVMGEDYEEGERGEPIGGKSLNTVSITAHLVKAIQELEARIKTLEDA